MPSSNHHAANVLGVGVDIVDISRATTACQEMIVSGRRGYVCVTGVHGVMEAQRNPEFRTILNNSFLTVPDGMPLVWVGHLQACHGISRVYGPDLMIELCRSSVRPGHRHFLYGGNEGVAQHLASNLRRRFPGLQIVGTYTPPFRPLSRDEEREFVKIVAACKPDVIWVGLSTPKQERFMARYLNQLDTKVMIGVGAAFDIHTGRIKDAPMWMKMAGLQWLHRLLQEPRRLWKRYLVNNPIFLVRIALQLAGVTRYRL
jgi:N-acetylglucosaminyldiphosphoundecaprenol N-acetyl-beta-D-mannosaminyltransferase